MLSVAERRAGIERLSRRLQQLKALEPRSIQAPRSPEIVALETSIKDTFAAIFGLGTLKFNQYKIAWNLEPPAIYEQVPEWIAVRSGGSSEPRLEIRAFQEGVEQRKRISVALLEQLIGGFQEDIELHPTESNIETADKRSQQADAIAARKIFIVHGREDGPREAVARFLEKLGFEAVILHEQANKGRTVIEKVEAHSDVGFAVVLLTPDDDGSLRGEPPQPRARQNVLLELGYFIGKLTRARVCALQAGDLEIPSDWRGVIDEPFDAAGAWKLTLARELEAAGYEMDWNKVMR